MKKLTPSHLKFDWQRASFIGLVMLLASLLVWRPPWDPDLGWHLRNGEDVLKFGAPRGDLYSHTMAGYPWISHEWLTDVLMYLTEHYWGLLTLTVIFALVVVAAYLIAARVAQTHWESTAVTVIIATLVALPIVGTRAQMITLVGLAATLWVLFRWRERPANRLIYWLPLLMIVWVNLHGGFAAGLILMGVFWLIELVKAVIARWRRLTFARPPLAFNQLVQLMFMGALSLAATFVNPYTWRIYDELFRTVFNPLVRSGIAEWLPVDLKDPSSYNLIIYAGFLVLLLIFSARRVDSTKIWIGAVFLAISLSSWRNMPLFSLVTLPLLSEMIETLSPKGISYYLRSFWVLLALVGLIVYVGRDRYYTNIPLSLDQSLLGRVNKYPYEAMMFIKQNKLPGKMFNEYNWGGYLIWQLPEKRVFIDGRMAVWQTKDQDIFRDYLAISQLTPGFNEILQRYQVSLALTYTDRPFSSYLLQQSDAWQLLYRDKLASVFIQKTAAPTALTAVPTG